MREWTGSTHVITQAQRDAAALRAANARVRRPRHRRRSTLTERGFIALVITPITLTGMALMLWVSESGVGF